MKNMKLIILALLVMVTSLAQAQTDLDAAAQASKERVGERFTEVSYGSWIDQLVTSGNYLVINTMVMQPGMTYNFNEYFGAKDDEMQIIVDNYDQALKAESAYAEKHKYNNYLKGLKEWRRKFELMGLLTISPEDANNHENMLKDNILSMDDWREGIKPGLYVYRIHFTRSFAGYLNVVIPEYDHQTIKPYGWWEEELVYSQHEIFILQDQIAELQAQLDAAKADIENKYEATIKELRADNERQRKQLYDLRYNQPNGLRVELGVGMTHRQDYDGRMNDVLIGAGVGWVLPNGLGAMLSSYKGRANYDFLRSFPPSEHFQGRSRIKSLGAADNAGLLLVLHLNPKFMGNWSARMGGGLDWVWGYDQQVQEYLEVVGHPDITGEPIVVPDVKATRSSWLVGAGYNLNREVSVIFDVVFMENDAVMLGPVNRGFDQKSFVHSFSFKVGYTF